MKDKQNRWPEVGDLLIHTDGVAFNRGEKCQGLVTEVVGGKILVAASSYSGQTITLPMTTVTNMVIRLSTFTTVLIRLNW